MKKATLLAGTLVILMAGSVFADDYQNYVDAFERSTAMMRADDAKNADALFQKCEKMVKDNKGNEALVCLGNYEEYIGMSYPKKYSKDNLLLRQMAYLEASMEEHSMAQECLKKGDVKEARKKENNRDNYLRQAEELERLK